MTVEVCDVRGVCAQNALTLVVTNTPPEITPEPVSTPAGSSKSINLLSITTDIDGNLDPTSFTITKAPTSKAAATIEQVSASEVNLLLNYEGITFHGTDQVTIRACDKAGACTESILSVEVDFDASVTVYNAIAPNSGFQNLFMRITGLPEGNKVSIFNRWGDKVFETTNYGKDLSGNTFKGLNDNGNALASGTYFYVIEIPGEKDITGYLTLKQ
jgi:gliding motility-associated-like protein